MISGIYLIGCQPNGRKYVGQSVDISRRWGQHRRRANQKRHSNKIFQACWNKYGEDNFTFEIIEECEVKLLTEKEIYWINHLRTSHKEGGLNLEEIIGPSSYGIKRSAETIEKRVSMVSKRVEAFGESKTIREWCEVYDQVISTVNWRLRKGWDVEKALSTPSQKQSISFEGRMQSLGAHCNELKLNPETVRSRIARGWDVEEALTRSPAR